jgi:molybdenum cofactor cytidylyltransferase
MMELKVKAVILAAGSSRRLGFPKQLLVYGGKTLLERTIALAGDATGIAPLVVLGCHRRYLSAICEKQGAEHCTSKNWYEGMGASFKTGLKYILDRPLQLDGVLFLVCDQPGLKADHLTAMMRVASQSLEGIVASRYSHSAWGVPALFKRNMWSDLMTLQTAKGAKSFIKQKLHNTCFVDFPAGGFDIDTQADLQQLIDQDGQNFPGAL